MVLMFKFETSSSNVPDYLTRKKPSPDVERQRLEDLKEARTIRNNLKWRVIEDREAVKRERERANKAYVSQVQLENYKMKAINAVGERNKNFVLANIYTSIILQALPHDSSYIEEMANSILATEYIYLKKLGGYNYIKQRARETNSNFLRSVCEAAANCANMLTKRKIEEIRNSVSEDEVRDCLGLNMTDDEKCCVWNNIDKLGTERIANLVNKNVVQVIQDENEKEQDNAKVMQELQGEMDKYESSGTQKEDEDVLSGKKEADTSEMDKEIKDTTTESFFDFIDEETLCEASLSKPIQKLLDQLPDIKSTIMSLVDAVDRKKPGATIVQYISEVVTFFASTAAFLALTGVGVAATIAFVGAVLTYMFTIVTTVVIYAPFHGALIKVLENGLKLAKSKEKAAKDKDEKKYYAGVAKKYEERLIKMRKIQKEVTVKANKKAFDKQMDKMSKKHMKTYNMTKESVSDLAALTCRILNTEVLTENSLFYAMMQANAREYIGQKMKYPKFVLESPMNMNVMDVYLSDTTGDLANIDLFNISVNKPVAGDIMEIDDNSINLKEQTLEMILSETIAQYTMLETAFLTKLIDPKPSEVKEYALAVINARPMKKI